MAVGVAEAQATVTSRTPIGNGRAVYVGKLAFGTEYETGGDTLASVASPMIPLPSVIESMKIPGAGGYDFVFAAGKIKVYGGAAAAKGAGAEAAAKTDLSAITATFELIGAE